MPTYQPREPQVIIKMDANGKLIAESWINGQRCNTPINSLIDVKDLITDQQDEQKRLLKAEKERQRAEAVARHNRVFDYVSVGLRMGQGEATRIVGPKHLRIPQILSEKSKPEPKADSFANPAYAKVDEIEF
jgi:hypothetical protein